MARKKVKYTVDEIINNLYTPGNEWMLSDYTEYIGQYHQYTTGETFTLAKWNPMTSVKLIKYREVPAGNQSYKNLKEDLTTSYESIQPHFVEISKKDRIRGYITRYFAYDTVNFIVIEINEKTYKKIAKKDIDPNVYQSVSLQWYITGELTDIVNGTFITYGVQSKNAKERNIAIKKINALSSYLTNLSEFYSDTSYIVPKDINNLDN